MKKEYEAPKAEKIQFDYSEAVVASASQCNYFTTLTEVPFGCRERQVIDWTEQV